MRDRLHLVRAIFLLVMIMSVYSCGPVVTFFNIESRLPAKYPIALENKSIALFVSVDSSMNRGNFLSLNDSLHMISVATGIAKEFENQLALEEGAVFVFNHYPGNERVYGMEYIHNLSFTSNSDIIVILDSLRIGSPKLLENIASSREAYKSSYVYAPIFSEIKVYNGMSTELLTHIRQIDTVYGELLSRSDVSERAMVHRVNSSVDAIAQNVGQEMVNKMFPSWVEQQRNLFRYSNREWSMAHSYATQFKWEEAMQIWLKETSGSNNVKVAAAAFNMAVACELTDRLDLALEWIDVAQKSYPQLPRVVSYKQFLTEKFESE